MQVDYLIIGQGICGTLLSWNLWKMGKTFVVIDNGAPNASSRVASGLINPVTGKRFVKSWLFDTLIPAAIDTYQALEEDLGVPLIRAYELLDFFAGTEENVQFHGRMDAHSEHLGMAAEHRWSHLFNSTYGVGTITPCYIISLQVLLDKWQQQLNAKGALRQEQFSWADCTVTDEHVVYKDIKAANLICCEGSASTGNPYFSRLPFSVNKGEAIIARIPDLPTNYVYKQKLKIIPWRDDLFWVGSSFEWQYEHSDTTAAFRNNVTEQLKRWLKLPFTITDHWAAERPSSVDYKPFAGFHPMFPRIGILNGMGAKACLQAPFFARQIAAHLSDGAPIMPDADVKRFSRVLSRDV